MPLHAWLLAAHAPPKSAAMPGMQVHAEVQPVKTMLARACRSRACCSLCMQCNQSCQLELTP